LWIVSWEAISVDESDAGNLRIAVYVHSTMRDRRLQVNDAG
jgi:hypothetical protein